MLNIIDICENMNTIYIFTIVYLNIFVNMQM